MEASVRFAVPSQPRFLQMIRAAVGELGAAYGFPAADCRAMVLAVDEALTNVIRHAYGGDPEGIMELRCSAVAGRLEFEVLDEGMPPDTARLSAPVEPGALGGRGTHIIRAVMDEVLYERAPRGNRLRLSKRLPATAAAVSDGGPE